MFSSSPLVSVIVPAYNSENHISECLDSLLGQTYGNLEIICVDDGSTDNTLSILHDYARRDGRVTVMAQSNAGPGAARNGGMDRASGEFLFFFDSDDVCNEDMLEKTVSALLEHDGDIAVVPYWEFDQRVGIARYAWWGFLRDKFPGTVVSWRDNPDWVFRAFQNFVWNKVFRASFLKEKQIRFPDLRLTEDLLFVAPALLAAKRIVCFDEPLVRHRQGTGVSAMGRKDAYPLDFFEAFKQLRAYLEDTGLLDETRIAYANWAADACVYNLHTLNTYEGFVLVFNTLKNGGLAELGLFDIDDSVYQEDRLSLFLHDVKQYSLEEYLRSLFLTTREERDVSTYRESVLVAQIENIRQERDSAHQERDSAHQERDSVYCELSDVRGQLESLRRDFDSKMNAAEQKVGQAVCYLPRKIQRALLKR